MKTSPVLKYGLTLLLGNVVLFAIHLITLSFFDSPLWDNLLIPAYLVNFSMALLIGIGLYRLKEKFTDSLGFIFLAGTALKFLIFFLVFIPVYKLDGDISKIEFVTFFIPYILNLIVETTFLVRVLNRLR